MKTSFILLLGLSLVGHVLLQDNGGGQIAQQPIGQEAQPAGDGGVVIIATDGDGVAPENGGGTTGGQQNATTTAVGFNFQDAVLMLFWYQDALWNSQGNNQTDGNQQWFIANYEQNAVALLKVAQAFGVPTLMVSYQNETNGPFWASLTENLTNVQTVDVATPGEIGFNNALVQQILQFLNKRNVIMAAVGADYDLVKNAQVAQQQGFNVWAILDCSPSYEPAGFFIASQNLDRAQITQKTWYALSQEFLSQQPGVEPQLNEIYRQFLPGVDAGGEEQQAEEDIIPAEQVIPPSDSSQSIPPSGGGSAIPPEEGQ